MAGPQPSEGEKRELPGVSPVPAECGLEPKDDDSPNPMDGFHVVHGVEEVKVALVYPDAALVTRIERRFGI